MKYDEFVNRPLVLYSRVAHQAETVQRLENICMNTTNMLDEKVQASRQNVQEKRLTALADEQRKLNDLTIELIEVCDEVRSFLYNGREFDDADILEWKYINGKTIQEISEIINTTYSGASTKISRAEKRAKKVYISKSE